MTSFLLAQAVDSAPHPGQVAMRIVHALVELSGGFDRAAIIALAAAPVISILAYWISARAVIGEENATLLNSLKLWVIWFVVQIGMVLVLGLGVAVAVTTRNTFSLLIISAGLGVLGLALLFLLPIKIYETNFIKAFLFVVVSIVLTLAGRVGVNRALGLPSFGRSDIGTMVLTKEKREKFLKDLSTGSNESSLEAALDRAEGPEERKRSIDDRKATIKAIFEQLDARQKALPPGDAAALADYEKQRTRYEEVLRVLKADYAASQAAPPAN